MVGIIRKEKNMSDILVIKVNIYCKTKRLNDIRRCIIDQTKSGVVVLPAYCEAMVVPEGIDVQIKDSSGEFVKGENL